MFIAWLSNIKPLYFQVGTQLIIAFAHLRYFLAGYRPSQTNNYTIKFNIFIILNTTESHRK